MSTLMHTAKYYMPNGSCFF